MSSTFVTLPGNTLQALKGIGIAFSTNTNPPELSHNLKEDKKVEVRWLESEAELYIKQWRRRYRQLEGIDTDPHLHSLSRKQSHLIENCDDWYLTAHAILDIDVSCLNSREYNKFILENQGFNLIFNRGSKSFSMFNTSFEEDEYELENNEFTPFEAITLDPNIQINQELLAALKSSNLVFKNGKLEKENIEKDNKILEKQMKKCQKLSPPSATITDSSSSPMNNTFDIPTTITNVSPNSTKCSNNSSKSPRKNANTNNKPRNRPNSTRRQMYTCEYPGCSYQSDRNFNFLRHKRTHGKQKSEDTNKRTNNTNSTTCIITSNTTTMSNNLFGTQKNANTLLIAASETTTSCFEAATAIDLNQNGLMVTNLYDSTSSASLLSNEFNMDITPPAQQQKQPQLNIVASNSLPTVNISENGHSYLLGGSDHDNYLQQPSQHHHQNIIMKDINNLDHLLTDNHHFSTLTLDQSFLS